MRELTNADLSLVSGGMAADEGEGGPTVGGVIGAAIGGAIGNGIGGPVGGAIGGAAGALIGPEIDDYIKAYQNGNPPGVDYGRWMQTQGPPGWFDANGNPWYDNY